MRVSRTRFSKRRLKRKTEFPIVAVVQKKKKNPSIKSQSFIMLRNEERGPVSFPRGGVQEGEQSINSKTNNQSRFLVESESLSSDKNIRSSFSGAETNKQGLENETTRSIKKKRDTSKPQKKSRATIDYKNIILLRNLITAEGKILPRRINKLTAKQQRCVQKAIKSARVMGLVPFINKSRPL